MSGPARPLCQLERRTERQGRPEGEDTSLRPGKLPPREKKEQRKECQVRHVAEGMQGEAHAHNALARARREGSVRPASPERKGEQTEGEERGKGSAPPAEHGDSNGRTR